jgi:hypothetical protein
MRGRTDLRDFRKGVQQAADTDARRRAFLRPRETAMLQRALRVTLVQYYEAERLAAACMPAESPGESTH